MTLNDLLGHILLRMEMMAEGSNAFAADEMARWPEGALDFFVRQRLLSPATPAHEVVCEGCEEGCFMTVEFPPADALLSTAPFIICNQRDDIGKVRVDPDRLKRWRADLGLLARLISKLLGIDQAPQELVRQRLWFLGKANLAGSSPEVFLARGLTWTDAGEIFGHNRDLRESVSPLIFTPGKPSNGFLPNATLVSLDRLFIIQKDRMTFDLEAIVRTIEAKTECQAIAGNVFQKTGQFWTISFEGRTFRLKDSKGLQYLHFLLAHPGEEFHAQRLLAEVEGIVSSSGDSPGISGERQFLDDGLSISSLGDAGPLLDDQARKEYKQRLDDLSKELKEAREFNDYERAERLEEEMEALTKELAAAYGLGGRARKLADPGEKARKTISKAIRRALEHIKENDEIFWRHLQNALSLGLFPAYKPHPPVTWII
ncbi:MAG: hypothetical protein PHX53_08860 [Syntrophales bacterium]|nr:hypothetical protein [Syntrophales bacterium]